jgi:hypothetical protein
MHCREANIAPSWNHFKLELQNIYMSSSNELDKRQKLRELKLKNFSSLSSYNDEFMRLIASIGISSEMDKIDKSS